MPADAALYEWSKTEQCSARRHRSRPVSRITCAIQLNARSRTDRTPRTTRVEFLIDSGDVYGTSCSRLGCFDA
jgi:hypothetical protein